MGNWEELGGTGRKSGVETRGDQGANKTAGTGRNSEELGGNGEKKIKLEELGETGETGGTRRNWEELGGTGRNWEELGGTWRKSGVETS